MAPGEPALPLPLRTISGMGTVTWGGLHRPYGLPRRGTGTDPHTLLHGPLPIHDGAFSAHRRSPAPRPSPATGDRLLRLPGSATECSPPQHHQPRIVPPHPSHDSSPRTYPSADATTPCLLLRRHSSGRQALLHQRSLTATRHPPQCHSTRYVNRLSYF